jgi:hypothetical protein
MGSHDSFGHLKHKLWSKEGWKIKLPNWLLTTRSRESPQFPCVQVACNIQLEKSQWGLQPCFRPHLDQRFAHKVMALQNYKSPNFENFRTKCHLDVGPMASHTVYIIKGNVVASPKSGPWWVLWVRICPWFVLAPKVLWQCTNQLVVWFCAGPCEWLNACHSS